MFGRRISILTPFEYGGIILIALCHLPAVVSGNTTADTHSAPASGEMNLSLVCEKGKRQSSINLSSSHRSHGHHTLEFLYQPMAMGVIHDENSFKGLSDGTNKVHLDGRPYQLVQFQAHDPSEQDRQKRGWAVFSRDQFL